MGCCVSAPESARRESDHTHNQTSAPTTVHRSQHSNHVSTRPSIDNEQSRESRSQRPREPPSQNGILRIQYLQNSNVEKVLLHQTSGSGIKKTPSYETPLSKEELEKWKKDFWGKCFMKKSTNLTWVCRHKNIGVSWYLAVVEKRLWRHSYWCWSHDLCCWLAAALELHNGSYRWERSVLQNSNCLH